MKQPLWGNKNQEVIKNLLRKIQTGKKNNEANKKTKRPRVPFLFSTLLVALTLETSKNTYADIQDNTQLTNLDFSDFSAMLPQLASFSSFEILLASAFPQDERMPVELPQNPVNNAGPVTSEHTDVDPQLISDEVGGVKNIVTAENYIPTTEESSDLLYAESQYAPDPELEGTLSKSDNDETYSGQALSSEFVQNKQGGNFAGDNRQDGSFENVDVNNSVAATDTTPTAVAGSNQAPAPAPAPTTVTLTSSNPVASEAGGDGQFIVSLDNPSSTDTVISYAVGGSATSGGDYSTLSGTVTILAGNIHAAIDVTVLDDVDLESAETVTIQLVSTSNAAVGVDPALATVTIADDEVATADLSVTINGNENGPIDIEFTVTLDIPNNTGSSITFDLSDTGLGSATAGVDYDVIPPGAQISVPNGATTGSYTVQVFDDPDAEGPETVVAQISNPSLGSVTIGTSTIAATITDDDNNPPNAVNDDVYTDQNNIVSIDTDFLISNDTDPDGNPLTVISIDDTGTVGTVVFNQVIGEFGQNSAMPDSGMTVNLGNDLIDFAAFAFVVTENDGEPVIARVSDVDAGADTFDVTLSEPFPFDDSHVAEGVSYLAIEKGYHVLADGSVMNVGTVDSNNIILNGADFENNAFIVPFAATPAIISQVQTDNNGIEFLKIRQDNASASDYDFGLERYESETTDLPLDETIAYLAVDQATTSFSDFNFISGQTAPVVTHNSDTQVVFPSPPNDLGANPNFFAQISTFNGGDDASVRAEVTSTEATLNIEEDISDDPEMNHGGAESIDYLALESGSGVLQQIVYDPGNAFDYLNPGETAVDTFSYTVSDGLGGTDTATVTVTIHGINDAPVLDASKDAAGMTADISIPQLNSDFLSIPSGAVGSLVSEIVSLSGNVTDPDTGAVAGIAVTGVIGAGSDWYYSTDNGASWSQISGVSDSNALLLDTSARLYFDTPTGSPGTIDDTLTFRAWDMSDGLSSGDSADTTVNGGSTAYSSVTDTVDVYAVDMDFGAGSQALSVFGVESPESGAAVLSALGITQGQLDSASGGDLDPFEGDYVTLSWLSSDLLNGATIDGVFDDNDGAPGSTYDDFVLITQENQAGTLSQIDSVIRADGAFSYTFNSTPYGSSKVGVGVFNDEDAAVDSQVTSLTLTLSDGSEWDLLA